MIKVLKAGFYSTIQDKGRVGFAKFGVPISGVMDRYSADLANHMLNNSLDSSLLEITFGGCSFEFFEKTIICISGADFNPSINGIKIPLNSRIFINKNDVLSFGKRIYGSYCYVAVKGGFLTEVKLKSRSFFQNITKNSFIKKGDEIHFQKLIDNFTTSNTSVKIKKSHFNETHIQCYKGPEFDLLTKNQQDFLVEQTFTISKDHNRSGFRLEEILENNLQQILTSAVFPGTVQLTPSGKLIVLMRDCQVTGGYPRILQLSENSINQLAQKTTNDTFKFRLMNV